MRESPVDTVEEKSETQRIEAFSDGVFAIAITLLVLEIPIPRAVDLTNGHHLNGVLAGLWPEYFAYVLSFVTIGIYWANHHYTWRLYKRTNHVFNMLNVLFLMCISFLPLPTAVLGQYFQRPGERHTAVVFYIFGLLLPAIGWWLLWCYGSYRYRLIDMRLDPAYVRRLSIQFAASFALYGTALVVALFSPIIGLCIAVVETAFYLMPPKPVEYRDAVVAAGKK